MLTQNQIDFIKKGLTDRATAFKTMNERFFDGIVEGLEAALRLIEQEEKRK
jgi:hypothetical protein